MEVSEIKAKIEKIKGMSGLSDKAKSDMIAAWEKKLKEADNGRRAPVSRKEIEFKVDDVVFNKNHNSIGIARSTPERGEIKTDADGNVPLAELEHYSRSNLTHQKADIAPSTRKEIENRKLATLEPESSEDEQDFEAQLESAPTNVKKAIQKAYGDEDSISTDELKALNTKLNAKGWEIDYGLDGVITSLTKIKSPGKKERKKRVSKTPAKEKTKTTYKFKGKGINELNDEDCADLIKQSKERREKAAKAVKKSKSRPIIEKVTAPIVKALKKAIENIPAADLKEKPKTELSRIDKAIAATKRYMMELKAILGEDFDKDTVDDEMKDLHALSKELHKKYGE